MIEVIVGSSVILLWILREIHLRKSNKEYLEESNPFIDDIKEKVKEIQKNVKARKDKRIVYVDQLVNKALTYIKYRVENNILKDRDCISDRGYNKYEVKEAIKRLRKIKGIYFIRRDFDGDIWFSWNTKRMCKEG